MTRASSARVEDRRPRELRIHGVGGSPGPALLGLASADDVDIVAEGVGTSFIARRDDATVEGYDWGFLTSGSSQQPFWVLLLPFTVLNVAGWMHPPRDRFPGQIRLIRWIVTTLGITMTASVTLWVAVVLVDLLGYQWTRRLSGLAAVRDVRLGSWSLVSGSPIQPLQVIGMTVGAGLASLAMWGFFRMAADTQREFEQVRPAGPGGPPRDAARGRWAADEDLGSVGFFDHAPAARRLLDLHRLVLLLAGAWGVAQAVRQAAGGADRLDLGRGLVVLGALEFGLVLVLGVASFPTGVRPWFRGAPSAAASAAVLAFALANAFFSGLILFVATRLDQWPALPPGTIRPPVRGGLEVALTDVWFLLVAASLLIAPVWILRQRGRGRADDLPPRRSQTAQALDGVDAGFRRSVARARGYAIAGHRARWLVTLLTTMLFVISARVALGRVVAPGGTRNPLRWTIEENPGTSLTWRAAAYLLPAFFLAAMATMRRATRSTSLRRSIGILWDVLTFWPRRFHPLAVRPYAERAVPELQSRLLEHVQGCARPVLMSAHSQGSILAFAAVAPLDPTVTGHVALVSFGSPLGTLFGPLFPAYFGPDQIGLVRGRLLGGDERGWRNFYRMTDPIGGPVLGDGGDTEIADPAVAAPRQEGPEVPPRERDRPPFVSIAGHSLYERERALKDWVATVKAALPPVTLPGGSPTGRGVPRAPSER